MTTTAVGTLTWPIQRCDVNSLTAAMAETAAASVVRLSWARAHLAVAGSSTEPRSVIPRASAPSSCIIGFHRMAVATVGSERAASFSAGDPWTLPAVAHNTRPDNRGACRWYSSWATMPPME